MNWLENRTVWSLFDSDMTMYNCSPLATIYDNIIGVETTYMDDCSCLIVIYL